MQLAQVLIAAGKEKEAMRLASEFDRAAFARSGNGATPLTRTMRRTLLYISGDFAGLEKFVRTDNSTAARSALFHSVVEQGRLAEAEKLLTNDEYNLEREYELVALSIAWAKAGDNQKADNWLQRALRELEGGDRVMVRAAALLRSAEPPQPESLQSISLSPKSKAVLAAALAVRHPTQAAAFCAMARKLNVDRTYPFHLVRRVTASSQ